MIRKLSLLSTVLLILLFKSSNAQEQQVSLMDDISYVYIEKLIATAKENHPRVKGHNSRIVMAKTTLANSRLGWLAPFSLSYVYSPATTINLENPTFFSGYQIGLNINAGNLVQIPANIKRNKEELKVSHYDREEYLLELTTLVKTRYFDYLKALKVLKISTQAYLDAKNASSISKYKYEKGEISITELSNASAQYAGSAESKLEGEVNLLVAKAALEELLGVKLEAIPN